MVFSYMYIGTGVKMASFLKKISSHFFVQGWCGTWYMGGLAHLGGVVRVPHNTARQRDKGFQLSLGHFSLSLPITSPTAIFHSLRALAGCGCEDAD
jgi:hypothetical protein